MTSALVRQLSGIALLTPALQLSCPYHFCLSDYIDKQKGVGSVGSLVQFVKSVVFIVFFLKY